MEGLLSSEELVLPGKIKVRKSENLLMSQKGSLALAFEVTTTNICNRTFIRGTDKFVTV
jgi:hypothetical protein